MPRPRRLPARDRLRRAAGDRRRDPEVRARRAPDAHLRRPVQPRPRAGRPGGRPRPVARRRRRRPECLRNRQSAGAPPLRAPPAGAVRVCPDDLPRHHERLRAEARGDAGDEGAGLSRRVLLGTGSAPRQPCAPRRRTQRGQVRGGVPADGAAGGRRAVSVWSELAVVGSATVYEAAGRRGLVDETFVQVVPESRAAGPARTVRCGQDDNLMVHAVMASIEPGDVVVLTMPEPRPVALVGELLATQAIARGAAALLVDASVRDVEELREMALPIWARWVRIRGATKTEVGAIGDPVVVGGCTIENG